MNNGDFEEGKGIFHNGIYFFLVKNTEWPSFDLDEMEMVKNIDTQSAWGTEYNICLILNQAGKNDNIKKEEVWKLLYIVRNLIDEKWPAYESLEIFWKNNKTEQKDEYGETIIVFKQMSFKF